MFITHRSSNQNIKPYVKEMRPLVLTLHGPMSDISDRTTINQILLSGFLIFSSQASKVKTTPVAILYFVIHRGTQFFLLRYKT